MIRRLLFGLVAGLFIGGLVAAGLVRLIGTSFLGHGGGAVALLSAAATGAVTGVVAGKPIWAPGAKVEAGIKAFFGALMGAGAMFALRRWGGDVSAPAALGGSAPAGDLPAIALPLVAAVLGALFGLDDSPDPAAGAKGTAAARSRIAAPSASSKAAGKSSAGDRDDDGAEPGARRAGR